MEHRLVPRLDPPRHAPAALQRYPMTLPGKDGGTLLSLSYEVCSCTGLPQRTKAGPSDPLCPAPHPSVGRWNRKASGQGPSRFSAFHTQLNSPLQPLTLLLPEH